MPNDVAVNGRVSDDALAPSQCSLFCGTLTSSYPPCRRTQVLRCEDDLLDNMGSSDKKEMYRDINDLR